MAKMLPRCPVCGKPMKVVQLRCDDDGVTVSGAFEAPAFAYLDEEDTKFIMMFLRTKGNLKEMERLTGIGYFALRGRLDKVLEKMGLTPIEDEEEQGNSEDVFKLLKEKKITVEEAIAILKKKRGENDGRASE